MKLHKLTCFFYIFKYLLIYAITKRIFQPMDNLFELCNMQDTGKKMIREVM